MAQSLPSLVAVPCVRRPMGKLIVRVIRGINLPNSGHKFGTIDPYVVVDLDGHTQRTRPQPNTSNPLWQETFSLLVRQPTSGWLQCTVMDDKILKDKKIGSCQVPVNTLVKGQKQVLLVRLLEHATAHLELELLAVDFGQEAPDAGSAPRNEETPGPHPSAQYASTGSQASEESPRGPASAASPSGSVVSTTATAGSSEATRVPYTVPAVGASEEVLRLKQEALCEQQEALAERQRALEQQEALAATQKESLIVAARLRNERELLEAKDRSLRALEDEVRAELQQRTSEVERRMKALQTRETESQLELALAKEQAEIALLRREKQLEDESAAREAFRRAEHEQLLCAQEQRQAELQSQEARLALESARQEEAFRAEEARLARLRVEQNETLEAEKARLAKERATEVRLEKARLAREAERLAMEAAEFDEKCLEVTKRESELKAEEARLALAAAEREEALKAREAELAMTAEEQQRELEAERARLALEAAVALKEERERLAHGSEVKEQQLKEMQEALERHVRLREEAVKAEEEWLKDEQARRGAQLKAEESRLASLAAEQELALVRAQDAGRELAQEKARLAAEAEARAEELRMEHAKMAQEATFREAVLRDEEARLKAEREEFERARAARDRAEADQAEALKEQQREAQLEAARARTALYEEEIRLENEAQKRLQDLKAEEERMNAALARKAEQLREQEDRIAQEAIAREQAVRAQERQLLKEKRRHEVMREAPELVEAAIQRQVGALEGATPYKGKAKMLGWLEPLLLVVAMEDADRASVAQRLSVDVGADPSNRYAVGFHLLTDPSAGVAAGVARASQDQRPGAKTEALQCGQTCWYDALVETVRRGSPGTRSFHQRSLEDKLRDCDDPQSRSIRELERAALQLLQKVVEGTLTAPQKQKCRALLGSPRAAWLRGNLKALGLAEFEGLWVELAVLFARKPAEGLDETEFEEADFWSFSGPEPPQLRTAQSEWINVVMRLLLSRLELAGKGVALAPYFHATKVY